MALQANADTYFAVMSAILLSRANDRLNTLRVLPFAINASPFMLFAREPRNRKYCKKQIVAFNSVGKCEVQNQRQCRNVCKLEGFN
eukprot:scaffold237527_cov23-Tisochrysis_lutea.AAC.1